MAKTPVMSLQQAGGGSAAALLDPPLPTDPVELAAFWKRVDTGLAEIKAGDCVTWEDLSAQISQEFGV